VKMGAVLTAMRDRMGLSQEALALKLNRSRSSIAKLENDKQTLEAQTLVQWARATNSTDVLVAYFTGFDGITILQQIMGQFSHVLGA